MIPEPRRRRPYRLHTLHRWVGAVTALVAIFLALTGLVLNHAHDWRLDRRWVRHDGLLDAYGIVPSPPGSGFRIGDDRWISQVGRTVFIDAEPLTEFVPALSGAAQWQDRWVLASGESLKIVAPDGTTVEKLYRFDLPGQVTGLEIADGAVRVLTPAGWFEADGELVEWRPLDAPAEDAAQARALPADLAADVGAEARRRVLTWERVMADLHAGRFLARAGPYVLDVAAILLTVLGISGLIMFVRGMRRRRVPRG